jgi:hypothetical protein
VELLIVCGLDEEIQLDVLSVKPRQHGEMRMAYEIFAAEGRNPFWNLSLEWRISNYK